MWHEDAEKAREKLMSIHRNEMHGGSQGVRLRDEYVALLTLFPLFRPLGPELMMAFRSSSVPSTASTHTLIGDW